MTDLDLYGASPFDAIRRYYASICGALTLTTVSLVEDHPVVLALSFPMGALMFVVVWLAAGRRPRRGRT